MGTRFQPFNLVTSIEKKMTSFCSVLAISLVVYLSEACLWPPPPSGPTTPAPTTTKTTPTTTSGTTTGKYECPIGGDSSKGVTCVSSKGPSNILEGGILPNIANPEECNKKCED